MALIKCPDCKKKVSSNADKCPYCGCPVKETLEKKKSGGGCSSIVFGVLATIYVIYMIFGNGEHEEKKEAEKNYAEAQFEQTPTPTPTPMPKAVSPKDSTSLFCLDLYENYEKYEEQYITISVPIKWAYENTVEIEGDNLGNFNITLLEPRNDLKNGDYVTVTGLVEGCFSDSVHIKNANISRVGEVAQKRYEKWLKRYSEKTGRILDLDYATEEEYKAACQEMFFEDLTYSTESLKGKYVKVRMYIQENGVMSPDMLYDAAWMELIQQYHLDRSYCLCGVYSKETDTYGSGGQMGLFFPLDFGYTGTDFLPGEYITVYGKIIAYNVDYWDGHNSAYFVPRYIDSES